MLFPSSPQMTNFLRDVLHTILHTHAVQVVDDDVAAAVKDKREDEEVVL